MPIQVLPIGSLAVHPTTLAYANGSYKPFLATILRHLEVSDVQTDWVRSLSFELVFPL